METPPLGANAHRHLSPADLRAASTFLVVAVLAGFVSFFLSDGIRELISAPPYRSSLPAPSDVARDIARVFAPHTPSLPEAENVVATNARGNWIRIPALSLNMPLATATTMENEDILRALRVGVVRYPNGVEPGQPGVVAIAGHSTGEPWKGRYRFAFLHARKLRPGDIIEVDHAGTRYTYSVTGQRMVNPKATPFLASAAETSRLSVITCWPLWTTKQRLVVDAELASAQRLVVRPAPRSLGEVGTAPHRSSGATWGPLTTVTPPS